MVHRPHFRVMLLGLLSRLFGKGDRDRRRSGKLRLEKHHQYFRIHAWIESRIGPLGSHGNDEAIKKELFKLLRSEERRVTKKQVAGLKAYIETNSYRRILEQ